MNITDIEQCQGGIHIQTDRIFQEIKIKIINSGFQCFRKCEPKKTLLAHGIYHV